MNKKDLILIIVLAFLIRIPFFYLSYNYNYPNGDAALYFDAAKNLVKTGQLQTGWIGFHLQDRTKLNEYVKDNNGFNKLEYVPPLYIYILGGIYFLSGGGHFYMNVVILNITLFLLSIILIYLIFKKLSLFTRRQEMLFAILFILNPLLLGLSVDVIMEMLFLAIILGSVYYYINIYNEHKIKLLHIVVLSIALSLIILTKYAGIPVVISILLHLLFNRKWRSAALIVTIISIIIIPIMVLRSYTNSHLWLSYFYLGWGWPYDNNLPLSGVVSIRLYKIYKIIPHLNSILNHYFSISYFSVLYPFLIIAFIRNIRNNYYSLLLLLLLSSFLFFFIINPGPARYQLYLIPLLLPLAISGLFNVLKNVSYKNLVLCAVFIPIVLIMFNQDIEVFKNYRKYYKLNTTVGDLIQKIDKNYLNDKVIVATNIPFTTYVTNNKSVNIPKNLTLNNLKKFCDIYGTQYFLIAENYGYPLLDKSEVGEKLKNLNKINQPDKYFQLVYKNNFNSVTIKLFKFVN